MERYARRALAALTILILADATTTHLGIQAGLVETNPAALPIFNTHGPTRAIQSITIAKLLVLLALDKATVYVPHRNTYRTFAYTVLSILHAYTAVSNLLLLL